MLLYFKLLIVKIFLDNIIYTKTLNGGVSNYWFELTKFLMKQENIELAFFEDEKAKSNFHRKELPISTNKIITTKSTPVLSRLMPIKYKTEEEFIYHSSYFRKLSGAKNQIEITTVYDFIHNYYSTFLNKTVHNNLKFNAIKRSKGIICISHTTYNDLKKFCPPKAHQKAEVIHVGVSDDYYPLLNFKPKGSILEKYSLEMDYLLFIGGRTNYKNFDFAAAVINHNTKLKLVIVGGGSLTDKERQLFSDEALQRIHFIPSVRNEELNILLNHAIALLYPSSYEGFGIPVVEAMRAGCPVIGLNNSTINEVASQSALLLDKLDISQFEQHIENLRNNDFRKKIIHSGFEESQKYSWEKSSRETFEFYNQFGL